MRRSSGGGVGALWSLLISPIRAYVELLVEFSPEMFKWMYYVMKTAFQISLNTTIKHYQGFTGTFFSIIHTFFTK